jgi:hypothetical protein
MFRAVNIYPKDWVGKNIKLFNCATEHKLCSGDLFYFETSDPEELPLPSFALLQRIAALSGAAEANDEADPDDSDDDPSNAIYDVEMEEKQSRQINRLLILDWLTYHNLPFTIV